MGLSIRLRLLLLVLLALLPAMAVTIWSASELAHETRRSGEQDCTLAVERATNHIEQVVAVTHQLLTDLTHNEAIQRRNVPGVTTRFQHVLKTHPEYAIVQLIDVDGTPLVSSRPFGKGVNLGDRKYFRDAVRTGQFSVGEYIVGRISCRPTINFALPINDEHGKVSSVLQVGVDLDELTKCMAVPRPEGVVMAATDHAGTFLYRSLDNDTWRGKSDRPERLREMAASETGFLPGIGVDNVPRIRFWRQVRLPGAAEPYIYVRAGIEQRRLYAAAWAQLQRNLLLIALAAAVSLLVASQLGYRMIAGRLARLAEVSGKMAAGDLSARTGLRSGRDEIGQLAEGFDAMAERIQQRDRSLQELNRQLLAATACMRVVTRAQDEQSLFQNVCRIICQDTGYHMAWVGLVESHSPLVIRAAAWSQVPSEGGTRLASNGPQEPNPEVIATLPTATLVMQDLTDSAQSWRSDMIRYACRSAIVMPLRSTDDTTIGVLAIYAQQAGAFAPEEVQMLESLAREMAFGVAALRARAERNRAELELRRARDEAVAANQAKEQFLAAASHELRTPLTPALLLLGSLEREPGIPEELRADLVTIREHVEIEKRLIGDLLDFAALRSGKLTLHPQQVDLHAILREAEAVCREGFRIKQQMLQIELKAEQSHLCGDRDRLRQVFWNLLQNAAKYTPEQGQITLRTSNESGRLRVEVTDTGIGIDTQTLQRLFTPFEQGPRRSTENYGGLGLGLAISKAIIESHGGTIAAHSGGVGLGSLFRVELPLAGLNGEQQQPAQPDLPPAGAQRILLVEDHLPTLQVLRRLLQREGHQVFMATTRLQAEHVAAEQELDIIISDIALPDGTGLDLMPSLRARGIRGIAMSGYGTEVDIEASRKAGFAEHLTKPVAVEALRQAIARLVSPSQG